MLHMVASNILIQSLLFIFPGGDKNMRGKLLLISCNYGSFDNSVINNSWTLVMLERGYALKSWKY